MSRPEGSTNKKPRRTDAVIHVYAGKELKEWVASIGSTSRGESATVVDILEAARAGRPWKGSLRERAK